MVDIAVSDKPVTLKGTPYPKGFEKIFSRFAAKLVESIATQFHNQTLKKLNKRTIEKFEDAQIGNYAAVFQKLSRAAKRKILKRFDNKFIKRQTSKVLKSLNRINQTNFYNDLSERIGVSTQQMIAQEGLSPQINALILETEEWVEKLRDDALRHFSANTLRVMAQGRTFEEVSKEFLFEKENRKNHAEFVARSQIANFNGLSNKIRYQKLGVTQAVWVTSKDERVRKSHMDRNGKVFDLDKGLYSSVDKLTLLPGVDYQCRCISRPILPGREERRE